MADRYPDDLFEQIRQLAARVEQLEAQSRQRPGATKASQGWRMTDMSVPSVGPGEIQIGCSDGTFFVATSDGVQHMPSIGAAVAQPSYAMEPPDVDYDMEQIASMVITIDSLFEAFLELLDSLQGAGLIEF